MSFKDLSSKPSAPAKGAPAGKPKQEPMTTKPANTPHKGPSSPKK
ncbi:MAG: hypothetical protein WCD16_07745 [Paracoccaceae bacterium]